MSNSRRPITHRLLIVGACLAVSALSATTFTMANAAAPPGDATQTVVATRPIGVPADYVATPNGFLHPDCVHELRDDELLMQDGDGDVIVSLAAASTTGAQLLGATSRGLAAPGAAGSTYGAADSVTPAQVSAGRHIPACTHGSFSLDGRAVAADAGARVSATPVRPTISGWIESASTSSLGDMSYMHVEWNVPPAPATKTGPTVFFFPGFETVTSSPNIIMQPVLGWNWGGSGISGWSMSSWNCCSVGSGYHSAFKAVTGSTMSGDVSGNGCSVSTGVCSTWSITTYDWGSQQSTTYNTTSGGRRMNWVFGGVLEVGSTPIGSCSQLPGTSVTFKNFYLEDVGNHIKTPSWGISPPASGLTPACGYGVSVGSDRSVTLRY